MSTALLTRYAGMSIMGRSPGLRTRRPQATLVWTDSAECARTAARISVLVTARAKWCKQVRADITVQVAWLTTHPVPT